jgi:hypothetical protein
MSFGLRRYILIVEEFVHGRALDTADPKVAAAAMRLLARLHENKRLSGGPLAEPEGAPPEKYIWSVQHPRVMAYLSRLQRAYGPAWPADLTDRVWRWMEAPMFDLAGRDGIAFRLTHDDVSPNNFLQTADGIRMLDLLTMKYAWVGPELIQAALAFGDDSPQSRSAVWQVYFQEAGEGRWREFLRQSGVAAGLFVLRELAQGRAFLPSGADALPDPEWLAARLRRIICDSAELWGDSPAQTDWSRLADLFGQPLDPALDRFDPQGVRILHLPETPPRLDSPRFPRP